MTRYTTLFGRVQARKFSMVKTSTTLPIAPNSKPSSRISQAIYSTKLTLSVFGFSVFWGVF